MANGDKVYMTPEMRIIVETDSFAMASPASVSRMGHVYCDGEEFRNLIPSIYRKMHGKDSDLVKKLHDRFFT